MEYLRKKQQYAFYEQQFLSNPENSLLAELKVDDSHERAIGAYEIMKIMGDQRLFQLGIEIRTKWRNL